MKDYEPLKNLWRRAFSDKEQYIDYYFQNKAGISRIYTDKENGTLVSMAFFTPYTVRLFQKRVTAYYIVGVATEEKYRGAHRMTRLLQDAMTELKDSLLFLCPENPAVYTSLGFQPIYWQTPLLIGPDYHAEPLHGTICRWESLKNKQAVIDFANTVLAQEMFDLYIERSVMYYNQVAAELRALNGNLLTICDDTGNISAIVNLICEEGQYEITELITRPEYGAGIMSLLLKNLPTDSMKIDDSHFLSQLYRTDIVCEHSKKPYIMCKMPQNKLENINCYINDIT